MEHAERSRVEPTDELERSDQRRRARILNGIRLLLGVGNAVLAGPSWALLGYAGLMAVAWASAGGLWMPVYFGGLVLWLPACWAAFVLGALALDIAGRRPGALRRASTALLVGGGLLTLASGLLVAWTAWVLSVPGRPDMPRLALGVGLSFGLTALLAEGWRSRSGLRAVGAGLGGGLAALALATGLWLLALDLGYFLLGSREAGMFFAPVLPGLFVSAPGALWLVRTSSGLAR